MFILLSNQIVSLETKENAKSAKIYINEDFLRKPLFYLTL